LSFGIFLILTRSPTNPHDTGLIDKQYQAILKVLRQAPGNWDSNAKRQVENSKQEKEVTSYFVTCAFFASVWL